MPPRTSASTTHASQSRRRLWLIGAVAVLACLAAWALFHHSKNDAAPAAAKGKGGPQVVEATISRQGTLAQTLTVPGQVIANRGVVLKTEIEGRIAKITFQEGAAVSASQVLFKLDDSVQQAQLAQAQANLQLALNNVGRYQRLLAENASSLQQVESAQADAKAAQANVQLAKANLAKTNIAAPFAGLAGIRQVNLGDYVTPGDALVNVTENSKLRITFRVPESQSANLQTGTPVLLLASEDATSGTTVRVEAVDAQADPATRTRQAQVVLSADENEAANLTPGQFIRVIVPVQQVQNALIVPDQALVPSGPSIFAYVIAASGTTPVASKTTVTVGLRGQNEVQILSGLNPGDQIVTAGQQKLQAPITPVKVLSATVITMAPSPIEDLAPAGGE